MDQTTLGVQISLSLSPFDLTMGSSEKFRLGFELMYWISNKQNGYFSTIWREKNVFLIDCFFFWRKKDILLLKLEVVWEAKPEYNNQ